MISKCANPACSTPFRYLRDGRLFRMELPYGAASPPFGDTEKKPVRRVEHFWLCADCARKMTLTVEDGRVAAKPIQVRAAAS